MERREFLAAAGAVGAGATAGCAGLFGTEENTEESGGEPALVEDRPDAVYYPTHREGMKMAGMGMAGDLSVGLMYSYAHRFWTMEAGGTNRVDIREEDDVHLMVTLWDADTETVLPVDSGVGLRVERDGEIVSTKSPWTMLSQNMGFHYGDNYALDGDGTYTVTVNPGSITAGLLGGYEGKFEDPGTAEIEFEYAQATRDTIPFETFEDQQGTEGALDLMPMDNMPVSTVPPRADLPGTVVGEGTSGDADFLATVIEEPAFADAPAYFAASPRTPYNDIPLPTMGLSATIERDGEAVYDGSLDAALHPDLGYHYGAAVDGVQSGDAVTITVDTVPRMARHEGYETAFLQMPPVEFTAN
ncbi:hypothetical protein ACFQDG_10405 [Natronoarchaeum mannanilyticum]|uniref:Iron transporter n=1 Tax=Natronoarchaeum mannanilyticum TaxID=926360 RepID=A0AAV3TC49_9EURY